MLRDQLLFAGLLLLIWLLAACRQTAVSRTPIAAATATILAPTATVSATATVADQPTDAPATDSRADADVLFVRAVQTGATTWTFHVTVAHPDTGWEDYADGWDVLLPDGTVIKLESSAPFTRLLLHPHETEQPFTRSQSGIEIGADVQQVRVRAHDIVDGFGGQEVTVDLTAAAGDNFTVERNG